MATDRNHLYKSMLTQVESNPATVDFMALGYRVKSITAELKQVGPSFNSIDALIAIYDGYKRLGYTYEKDVVAIIRDVLADPLTTPEVACWLAYRIQTSTALPELGEAIRKTPDLQIPVLSDNVLPILQVLGENRQLEELKFFALGGFHSAELSKLAVHQLIRAFKTLDSTNKAEAVLKLVAANSKNPEARALASTALANVKGHSTGTSTHGDSRTRSFMRGPGSELPMGAHFHDRTQKQAKTNFLNSV
jgi:hypothetical protein